MGTADPHYHSTTSKSIITGDVYSHIYIAIICSGAFNLKTLRSRRMSSISESESEWRSESIIFHNPAKLPVIYEGKEIDLKFEDEYEDNEFGPDEDIETECVVEVNLTAADVM